MTFTPSLLCTNKPQNHWTLSLAATADHSNEKIAAYISEIFKPLPFSLDSSPVITWENPHKEKRRALYNGSTIYFPQSEKQMEPCHPLQGRFKTGREVEAFMIQGNRVEKDVRKLLLFKNKKNGDRPELSINEIRQDIHMRNSLSQKTSYVKKPLDVVKWISRRGNDKIGFISEKEIDLFSMILQHQQTLRKLPTSMKREIQKQIAQALHEVIQADCLPLDTKLENILLDKKNNIQLIDFGRVSSAGNIDLSGCTLTHIAPEHALLLHLQHILNYKIPPEVLSACIDEKTIIYTVGLLFLLISEDSEDVDYLRPLSIQAYQNETGMKPGKVILQNKMRWLPESFLNYLHTLDPNMPKSDRCEWNHSIPFIANSETWNGLLESMLVADPRERPSLDVVLARINRIIEDEEKSNIP